MISHELIPHTYTANIQKYASDIELQMGIEQL